MSYFEGLDPHSPWQARYDESMARGQELFTRRKYNAAAGAFGLAVATVDDNGLACGIAYRSQSQALELAGHTFAAESTATRALDMHTPEEWQRYTTVPPEELETTRAHLGGVVLRNALRSTVATGRLDKPGIVVAGRHLSVALPRLLELHSREAISGTTLQEALVDGAQLNIFSDHAETARTMSAQAVHLATRGELLEGIASATPEHFALVRHPRHRASRRALTTDAIALYHMRDGHLPENKVAKLARRALVGYPKKLQ